MKDKIIGSLYFIGTIVAVALFFVGAQIISEYLLPTFQMISVYVFLILLIICLPLSFVKQFRKGMYYIFNYSSYVFGFTVWMWGYLLCLIIWGFWAVFVGLMVMGVGVVPIAILACMFKGEWGVILELIILIFLTFGSRAYAFRLQEKMTSANLLLSPETDALSPNLYTNENKDVFEGETMKECSNCGEVNAADNKFCVSCGNKI